MSIANLLLSVERNYAIIQMEKGLMAWSIIGMNIKKKFETLMTSNSNKTSRKWKS